MRMFMDWDVVNASSWLGVASLVVRYLDVWQAGRSTPPPSRWPDALHLTAQEFLGDALAMVPPSEEGAGPCGERRDIGYECLVIAFEVVVRQQPHGKATFALIRDTLQRCQACLRKVHAGERDDASDDDVAFTRAFFEGLRFRATGAGHIPRTELLVGA